MDKAEDRRIPAAGQPLAAVACVVADGTDALRNAAGSTTRLTAAQALDHLAGEPHLLCHRSFTIGRLALGAIAGAHQARVAAGPAHLDAAELYAFVCPAQAGLPTPRGLARALGLHAHGDAPDLLRAVAQRLIDTLRGRGTAQARELRQIANHLRSAQWAWAPLVLEALGGSTADAALAATGLNVWDRLIEWEDPGPRPRPGAKPVAEDDAAALLARMLGGGAEDRAAQRDYCRKVSHIFAPKETPGENAIVLAEAGTGLGKTLGYLAPSALWAQQNGGTVWISTYTKNLQRQLEQETHRLHPDAATRAAKVVVRKGRENYLCLLNLQEWMGREANASPRGALFAALVARWARATRDGDMVGGDFPAWLVPLFAGEAAARRRQVTPMSLGLTDRRGECIYSACPHYRKCFIEKVQRQARHADIVIANHALVMAQAALGDAFEDMDLPAAPEAAPRIVFDEGHHVFDAADNAYSGHLTGLEMTELRRWVRGPETRGRRGRGLMERLGGLLDGDEAAEELLQAALGACRELPSTGWMQRVHGANPVNSGERFLHTAREHILARTENRSSYALEAECRPLTAAIAPTAGALHDALGRLARPLRGLAERLHARLDDDASELDSAERARIEALVRGLMRRAALVLPAWQGMLEALEAQPDPEFAEWFGLESAWGQEIDVGLHRHWIDPTKPFARSVLETTDGVLITSATLKDRPKDVPDDWQNAEMRTGVAHLALPAERHTYASPFDYGTCARLVVVTDVNREDADQVAAAYRELFLASRGGALGLFTAITRLRAVQERLIGPLGAAGLPLYAQHVDPIDIGTLVDLFRDEADACLLGTDAVRDGVDVPGRSLRLIVMDRVPWAQPTVLERARRAVFGGNAYQDMIVRLRLRQAFGRLIRSDRDRGVFVVLDARLASRFATAFPEALGIERMGLVDAIDVVREFLDNSAEPVARPDRASTH
jgi:ATP-dependent DNA helicase DinG